MKPNIVLNDLLAFPGAFGYGKNASGGRGGSIYFVTNLNNSGAGSFREAINQSSPKTIVVKVSGEIILSSAIAADLSNTTIIGQTAVGLGITLTGHRFYDVGTDNFIMRFITIRTNNVPLGQYDALSIGEATGNIYLDHISSSYGADETLSVATLDNTLRLTLANCLMGEGDPAHNTGSIVGNAASNGDPGGKVTFANNMTYNISHRFPNFGGNSGSNLEVYNNLYVNWQARLTRINGEPKIDWYNNYAEFGNHAKSSSDPVNKWAYDAGHNPEIFTQGNIVETFVDNPNEDNRPLWVYQITTGPVVANDPIDLGYFVGTRNSDTTYPAQGLLTALETKNWVLQNVGNNRKSLVSGGATTVYDDLDTSYIYKTQNNLTEVTYRDYVDWINPTIPVLLTGWTDSNSNGIADSFEATHGLSGDGTSVTTDWDFGGYTVTNNAGYTNREMYWAYLADDFLRGIDFNNTKNKKLLFFNN